MKRKTLILKEIRDNGYSVHDERFNEDLANITPAFQEGGVTFYPDNTAEILQVNYKKRHKVVIETPAEVPTELTLTQLERIEYSIVQLAGLVAQIDIKLDKLRVFAMFQKPSNVTEEA